MTTSPRDKEIALQFVIDQIDSTLMFIDRYHLTSAIEKHLREARESAVHQKRMFAIDRIVED